MKSAFIDRSAITIKMMSRPDFMAKQVLVLDSDNSKKFKFSNQNLQLIDENNKIEFQHPCCKIFLIFIVGEFSITSVLIKNFRKYGVPVIFLNYSLKCYFSISTENKGNFLLREKQYLNKTDFNIAKKLIENKIHNQLILMKSVRYKTVQEKEAVSSIENYIDKISTVSNSNELLGIEGNSSKLFFETYFKNMGFIGRKPRCKIDIYNVLLDIGYTYLFNFIEANLELYGFDTYYGVFHKLFYQRKSLVCDIMEPFRCIIDKRLRKSFNLKQINPEEFDFKNGQYFVKRDFNKKYTQIFLKEILLYKEEIFLFIQSYYRSFIREKQITSEFYIGDNDDDSNI